MRNQLIGMAALLALVSSPAVAHQAKSGMAYEAWCCNGKDCAEIPDTAVTAGPEGWVITLWPGQHPMVTRPIHRVIPYQAARRSEDGRFHLCLWPTEADDRCFYAPPQGF